MRNTREGNSNSKNSKQAGDEFEYLIFTAITVLREQNDIVELDAKIPDPDNPKQLRQIDILVTNNAKRTLVECRNHSEKQNTKWIEELLGRRISLGVDRVIGVSKSGFTEGAKRKAARYKIPLYFINKENIEESRLWATEFEIILMLIKFDKIKFTFNAGTFEAWQNAFNNQSMSPDVIHIINAARSIINQSLKIDELDNKILQNHKSGIPSQAVIDVKFSIPNEASPLYSGDLHLEYSLLEANLTLTSACTMQSDQFINNGVKLYEFHKGFASISRGNDDKIYISIDMKKMNFGNNVMMRYFETRPDKIVSYDFMELLNPSGMISDIRNWDIEICQDTTASTTITTNKLI